MLARLARIWRKSAAPPPRAVPDFPPLVASLASDTEAIGVSIAEWCRRRRAQPVIYSSVTPDTLKALQTNYPDRVSQTIAAAERVSRHEFSMLGSGPYVPVDPDRARRNGYTPIDWHGDPQRGLRFSTTVHHKEWNLPKMQPGNADVKFPWEIGRCQHWATLGQAFLFTRDERFAREIASQLDDFVEANPVGRGVNWGCTMDVGLRAVSWAIALELIRSSSLDDAFWERAYTSLFDHAVFIRNNLENTYEVTSNHYLSNLLGLIFAAAVFDDLPLGSALTTFSRASLEEEMTVQVLPDGADYESSIPYHRLVAELFLGAVRLFDRRGMPMPSRFVQRVRGMVEFFAGVTRPDGLMPQVGDADDGRLHILGGYGTMLPQDGRHLFGPAGAMFNEPSWSALGGDAGKWEAAWWGFAAAGPTAQATPSPLTRLFRDAGVAVVRTPADDYLLITNGKVGTSGFGNHKHNDLLSFEFHRRGRALIVDPGSYVYTSDPTERNRFRSTAFHNTLAIDGVEQNDTRAEYLFRIWEVANAETRRFRERSEVVEYVGRHHGYERLPQPVTHERTFRFSKSSGALRIVDLVTGRGRHHLHWHFHLAPGVDATLAGADALSLSSGTQHSRLTVPPGLQIALNPVAYSPSYGVKLPCLAIDVTAMVDCSGRQMFEFSIEP